MCKKDCTGSMESLQCLHPKIQVNEIQHDVDHFADDSLGKFASKLVWKWQTYAENCTTPSLNFCHAL